jgi:Bacteriophage holin of superfamily 6 (Holin_LLH)
MDTTQLTNAAITLLVTLAPVVAALLAEYLRRKIGTERLKRIKAEMEAKQTLVDLGVAFAQQAYWDLEGPERYEKAAVWIAEQAGKIGLTLTDTEAKGLIESAVRALKNYEWVPGQILESIPEPTPAPPPIPEATIDNTML